MPSHRETHALPYTPQQMFDLVVDIEAYPRFVPGYLEARVRQSTDGQLFVEQTVAVGPVPLRFRSVALLERPRSVHIQGEGQLSGLDIHWHFQPQASGCQVEFTLDFTGRGLLRRAASPWIALLTGRVVAAFLQRARTLYG